VALVSRVTIYSRDGCVYCDMAVALAEKKNMEISVLKLGTDYSVEEFQAKFIYAKTVPQIVLDGEHIGGYQDLKDLV
jgi:glutaredoxin 3